MNNDIELLNRGILPDSLNFNKPIEPEFDIHKLAYNLRYKTTEYWESKFQPGFECIPGFDKIIEKIVDFIHGKCIFHLKRMAFCSAQCRKIRP